MKKLPIYRVKVGGEFADAKLDYVSLVDQPAIQTKALLFSNNLIFKFEKEKQIITGPAMIPNQLIYRRDKEMGEFYVVFEVDAILELATKFNREVKEFKINVDHADVVPSAFITESWIVDDPEMDKAKSLGFDVPAGTWMLSVKVEDEAFWNDEVKAKGQFGFSVEGLFGLEATNEMFKAIQSEEFEHINNDDNLKLNTQEMNKSKLKFAEAMLADGTSVWVSALEVGGEVYLFDRDSLEKTPAPDGDHELEDGTVVTTVDGIITEVKAKEEEAKVEIEVEAQVDPQLDAEAVLSIVEPVLQAKLDEVYGVIAELKAMLESTQAPATVTDEAMSTQKFNDVNPLAAYLQFVKRK